MVFHLFFLFTRKETESFFPIVARETSLGMHSQGAYENIARKKFHVPVADVIPGLGTLDDDWDLKQNFLRFPESYHHR